MQLLLDLLQGVYGATVSGGRSFVVDPSAGLILVILLRPFFVLIALIVRRARIRWVMETSSFYSGGRRYLKGVKDLNVNLLIEW